MFPINFIQAWFHPRKIFDRRNDFALWQLILAFLFVNALMLMPMSVQMQSIRTSPLQDYFPQAMKLVDDSTVNTFHELTSIDGKTLQMDTVKVMVNADDRLLVFAPDALTEAGKRLEGKTGIIFTPSGFVIQEPKAPLITQTYQEVETLIGAQTVSELTDSMSEQWFQDNRMAVILSRVLNVSLLLTVSNLIFVLGSSVFLYLMKGYRKFDIRSYKEAVAIALMSLGLPSLVCMVLGFWLMNPLEMITLQGIGFIIMLVWTFWVTHFNDEYNKRGV